MAHARDAARATASPIRSLAIARAAPRAAAADRATRRPGPPGTAARGPPRQSRRRADPRDQPAPLALHELDPAWHLPARSLWRPKHLNIVETRLITADGLVARLARGLAVRCRELSAEIQLPDKEIAALIQHLARPCNRSAAAPTSPPRRSSVRPPTFAGSGHGTPTPVTTAPRHSPSGPPTSTGTG